MKGRIEEEKLLRTLSYLAMLRSMTADTGNSIPSGVNLDLART